MRPGRSSMPAYVFPLHPFLCVRCHNLTKYHTLRMHRTDPRPIAIGETRALEHNDAVALRSEDPEIQELAPAIRRRASQRFNRIRRSFTNNGRSSRASEI